MTNKNFIVKHGIEVDGNLITGRNPESSKIFGDKVVEVLMGRNPSSAKKK